MPLIGDDQVCLIRNYRVAVGEELIELPAGTIDPPEDPFKRPAGNCSKRPAFEAGSLEKLHEFWVSPGILSERMHLFVARDLTPGAARLERGEQIRGARRFMAQGVGNDRRPADSRCQDDRRFAALRSHATVAHRLRSLPSDGRFGKLSRIPGGSADWPGASQCVIREADEPASDGPTNSTGPETKPSTVISISSRLEWPSFPTRAARREFVLRTEPSPDH